MSGVWLGLGFARDFFIFAFRVDRVKPILFGLRLGRVELLRRRAGDACLDFRTSSIGIVFGV